MTFGFLFTTVAAPLGGSVFLLGALQPTDEVWIDDTPVPFVNLTGMTPLGLLFDGTVAYVPPTTPLGQRRVRVQQDNGEEYIHWVEVVEELPALPSVRPGRDCALDTRAWVHASINVHQNPKLDLTPISLVSTALGTSFSFGYPWLPEDGKVIGRVLASSGVMTDPWLLEGCHQPARRLRGEKYEIWGEDGRSRWRPLLANELPGRRRWREGDPL